jgi:hypothetical protein
VLWQLVVIMVFALPLGLSLWALLDAARRPAWAWSLAERSQVSWIAAILMGVLVMIAGVVVSSWYLLRIRPAIAAAEEGRIIG